MECKHLIKLSTHDNVKQYQRSIKWAGGSQRILHLISNTKNTELTHNTTDSTWLFGQGKTANLVTIVLFLCFSGEAVPEKNCSRASCPNPYLVPSSPLQYASSVHLTQGLVTKSVSCIEHCSKGLKLREMTSNGADVILAQGLACSMHQSFPQSIALMKNGLELNLNL